MNEKYDWEQRLKEAGMPAELPPVGEELAGARREVAGESKKLSFEKEILDMPDPVIRLALEKFGTLSEEQQRVIIEDIKGKKETKMPLPEIIGRIYRLVEGTYQMVKISPAGTEGPEEEGEGEPDGRAKTIDELIEKMERISQKQEAEKNDGLVN